MSTAPCEEELLVESNSIKYIHSQIHSEVAIIPFPVEPKLLLARGWHGQVENIWL